jgi:hypothetical protein
VPAITAYFTTIPTFIAPAEAQNETKQKHLYTLIPSPHILNF